MYITETRSRDGTKPGKICYRLDMCLCAQDCGPPHRITYHSPLRKPQLYSAVGSPDPNNHDCTQIDTRQSLGCYAIPLSLLQVCRQIYHEAALKPFSQTTFIIDGGYHLASRAFVDALVPTQAKAIIRVHFACHDGMCPAFKVIRHLKKLEVLTVQIVENIYNGATEEEGSMTCSATSRVT